MTEQFFPKPESLDAIIQKKPKEDPVGVFLERFGKTQGNEQATSDQVDISYLTPAQRAESMWALFQAAKHSLALKGEKAGSEEEQRKMKLRIGALKSFYDDVETREEYKKHHRRHREETESINGNLEKYKALDREMYVVGKAVDGCAREMFASRGSGIEEIDILIFETNKKRLQQLAEKMKDLLQSNPELAGLAQYHTIVEGAEQLKKENFIWKPSRQEALDELEEAALSGKPVLVSGESGTGKSRFVEQASLKLTGQINSLTPGKETRFQDLIAKPKISIQGESHYEYKEIGEAATGRATTLETTASHQGRIVADDEFNLRPKADQTEMMARISSWTPGKTVRMPVTNQELTIAPNFLYCGMVNLDSERYDTRNKIPAEVLRKFAKVNLDYPKQSESEPEIYEMMVSALMDENRRMRAAKGELTPQYEFREETKTVEKEGQEVKQIVNIRELKTVEDKNGKTVVAGGFLWRLAGALDEINKSFSHKETILKARGEAQYLKDLIIDIGTILGWLKEYRTRAREKSLESFFSEKFQKEFLSKEEYSADDRQLVGAFLSHYGIEIGADTREKPEFEIMTPLEIGLLSPRVHYEKLVSEEPVLTESYFITPEGKRVEYRRESFEGGGKKFVPGELFKLSGGLYEFLGIDKVNGDPVHVPYKEKPRVASRKESVTYHSQIETIWNNLETNQDQKIEINLEQSLSEQIDFYKNQLNLSIDQVLVREIWQENYQEIKSEIEKYGYDQILIIPENLPDAGALNTQLIETMEEEKTVNGKKVKEKVAATYRSPNFEAGGNFTEMKNPSAPEYRIVLTHSIPNIEDHPILKATRNKNIMAVTTLDEAEVNRRIADNEELPVNCEVEINGQKFTIQAEGNSLEEYILQQKMYFDKTGEHLDAKSMSYARLLDSRSGARVVSAYWIPGDRQLYVYAHGPADAHVYLGLRLSRSFKKLA